MRLILGIGTGKLTLTGLPVSTITPPDKLGWIEDKVKTDYLCILFMRAIIAPRLASRAATTVAYGS